MVAIYYIHIGAVIFSFGVLLAADTYALDWFLGSREKLNVRVLRVLHSVMWIGLLAVIGAGATMAFPIIEVLLRSPLFIAKMCFVGFLFTNAFVIGSLMHVATERSFASLSWRERAPLFISGAVSTISWVSAALLGLYLF